MESSSTAPVVEETAEEPVAAGYLTVDVNDAHQVVLENLPTPIAAFTPDQARELAKLLMVYADKAETEAEE